MAHGAKLRRRRHDSVRSMGAFDEAISTFGLVVEAKLNSPVVVGHPEDQLRNPIEQLIHAMNPAVGSNLKALTVIGEVSLSDLKTRPDFAVLSDHLLVGFIELKAPGKGADPSRFRGHDRAQSQRLLLRPNILFTDGQAYSLWQNGEQVGTTVTLIGDVITSGSSLAAPDELKDLFYRFFSWNPTAPRSAPELATTAARLCRLLRDEVNEELERGDKSLKEAANDWRHLLFPEASDEQFADGYAQAVTFGMLIARAKNIDLHQDIALISDQLGATNSLIGRALQILANASKNLPGLTRAIETLRRVLAVVEWAKFGKIPSETWLYFYEGFLAVYDPALRQKTGSYYTPPPVVSAMTRWTNEAIRDQLGMKRGLADPSVHLIDPAMGTGTFLLEVFRVISEQSVKDYGVGAAGGDLTEALNRLVGFEIQLGPFAVAQLRILAELATLGSDADPGSLRTYVADTLSNPYIEDEAMGQWYEPISASRRAANTIKREEDVLVVLGNPPYKEKALGRGAWVEKGSESTGPALLTDYMPPRSWGIGTHARHLRNLYVYFWRWATWKVFDQQPDNAPGIVCFITVAGFLDGTGFQKMRAKLREQSTDIWVVHCSPEGHMSAAQTRIFQSVKHEVCIVLALRRQDAAPGAATVRFRTLAPANRDQKFVELAGITLDGEGWTLVDRSERDPFTPAPAGEWAGFTPLHQMFAYDGTGVMAGRSWIYAPDQQSLRDRWKLLQDATTDAEKRGLLLHHADRDLDTKLKEGLAGHEYRSTSLRHDHGEVVKPTRIAVRSLDRQWVIPDKRLINRPNPTLWASMSDKQIFLTAIDDDAPPSGPAISFSADIPDVHHYHGRGGRVFPLWADAAARSSNLDPNLLMDLGDALGREVSAEELFAYIAGVVAHPAYTEAFHEDLKTLGIRVPITTDPELFAQGVELGTRVLWLQTFGTRTDYDGLTSGSGAPRLSEHAPTWTKPVDPGASVDVLGYRAEDEVLEVGSGEIANVTPAMRMYEIGGKNVLDQWFAYRRADRTKPMIGERRISPLQFVQPDGWLQEYSHDLIDLLNVIGMLIELEADQAALLELVRVSDQLWWIAAGERTVSTVSGSQLHAVQVYGQTALIDI